MGRGRSGGGSMTVGGAARDTTLGRGLASDRQVSYATDLVRGAPKASATDRGLSSTIQDLTEGVLTTPAQKARLVADANRFAERGSLTGISRLSVGAVIAASRWGNGRVAAYISANSAPSQIAKDRADYRSAARFVIEKYGGRQGN